MRKNLPVGTIGYDASSGQYIVVTSSSSSVPVGVRINGPLTPMTDSKPKNNRERYLDMISEGKL
jgi:hypothetical protein